MFRKMVLCTAGILLGAAVQANAHFGMAIPSRSIVTQDAKTVDIALSFSHPFELVGMELVKPTKFFVVKDGAKNDLLSTLKETEVMGKKGWQTSYKVKRPGVYHFAMEPTPYWEPAEDVSIIHYTKVIVPAFGSDEGWDQQVGLPTEIIPMTRPFGNYSGNTFTGQVLISGNPAPFAEVEVELYNQENKVKAPSDYHITQVVKADSNGVFSFTCPQEGWWGFAALSEAEYTLKNPKGEDKGVELGAVLWIYMDK